MDLYVYSDESGVFDKAHNKIFVFGGVLFLSKKDKEDFTRKYIHAERVLREDNKYKDIKELKACLITSKDKGKLFRSTNQCLRFGIVIHMDQMLDTIFENKKSKQRYLDYAFKIGLRRFLQKLIEDKIISMSEINDIFVYVDEHTTATNGIYELREALLQEFKYGTHNDNWSVFFPPLLPTMKDVKLFYCDSSKKPLVRAADIIANRVFHDTITGKEKSLPLFVVDMP